MQNKPHGEVKNLPFIDLQAQYEKIADAVHKGIEDVCKRGQFIMGDEVIALEDKLAAFTGARHALSCGSGTDALLLALLAWGIGRGDAVFVPGYTYVATAEAVALLGAVPIFVDVEDDFLLSLSSLEEGIESCKALQLKPRAVMPVDLFGMPCDTDAIRAMWPEGKILADGAQSFGGIRSGKKVGQMGDITTTSFYPAKPLGCYGEGGAVFTDDDAIAESMRLHRSHGEKTRYKSTVIGLNARLDTLQAVVLLEKLKLLDDELLRRNRIAKRYNEGFASLDADAIICPDLGDTTRRSSWAQYTLRLSARDKVQAYCKERGIPSVIYYPLPLSHQPAYRDFPRVGGRLKNAEKLATQALSLPMSPYMKDDDIDYIIDVVSKAVKSTHTRGANIDGQ